MVAFSLVYPQVKQRFIPRAEHRQTKKKTGQKKKLDFSHQERLSKTSRL